MKNMSKTLAGYRVREERLDGKDYLVAPVVALAEGVHTGTDRVSTLYPAEEIGKFVDAWNGTPVVMYHTNGSANTPKNMEKRIIGQLFNTTFDPDGAKIRSEIWIDVDKAQKVSPAVVSTLRAGRNLDVSASSIGVIDRTTGEWNGERYTEIWRDLRPDHLALLPGGKGACSYADGCGVRDNMGGEPMKRNVRGMARSPSFNGTETASWGSVKKTFAAYAQAYLDSHEGGDMPSTVADAPAAMRSWIASKTLLGEKDADNERDLMFFPVVNPKTGALNEGALKAVISGRGEAADIPDGAKASAQEKARKLLEEHFDYERPKEDSAFANLVTGTVVAALKKMNMSELLIRRVLKLNAEVGHSEIHSKLQTLINSLDNAGWTHFIREVFDDRFVYEAMGMNPSDAGVAGEVKFYEQGYSRLEDGEVELFGDPREVKEQVEYVSVDARADNSDPGTGTKKKTEDEEMEKRELVDGLIGCECTKWTEGDRDALMNFDEGVLKKMAVTEEALAKLRDGGDDPPPKDNQDGGEPTDGGGPVTVEKFLAELPPELGNVFGTMAKFYNDRKKELVGALKSNEKCSYSEKELGAMEVEELQKLAKLAGDPVAEREMDYTARVGAVANRSKDNRAPKPKLMHDLQALRENRGKRAGVLA